MKLYNFPFGPYPQRVAIYLSEKGLANIEVIHLEPPNGKTGRSDFLKHITPAGSLPAIVDDDGTVVGQSLAILEYIEDTHPEPDMRGKTAAARAHTREFINVFDEALTFFGLWARHGSHLSHGINRVSRDMAEICSARYFQKLRLAEKMIDPAMGFIAGDTVTIADCVAMATLHYIIAFYDVPIPSDCPKLVDWYARFSARLSAPPNNFPQEQHRFARNLMEQTGITI